MSPFEIIAVLVLGFTAAAIVCFLVLSVAVELFFGDRRERRR